MPRIIASAPVLLVSDVTVSAKFYKECAGFDQQELYGEPVNFCICRRDGLSLMLAQVEHGREVVPLWKVRDKLCSAYFWVEGADALYDTMKARGAKMDYGPCTQPYGVREFGIQYPDGHDISFGEVIEGNTPT